MLKWGQATTMPTHCSRQTTLPSTSRSSEVILSPAGVCTDDMMVSMYSPQLELQELGQGSIRSMKMKKTWYW